MTLKNNAKTDKSIFSFLSLLTLTMFLTNQATADDLAEVLSDPKLDSAVTSANDDIWFSTPNLKRVFQNKKAAYAILEWLEVGEAPLFSTEERVEQSEEFVKVMARYKLSDEKSVATVILVPHPKFLSARQAGLIKEFNRNEFVGVPNLKLEDLTVAHSKAKLIKSDKESVVLFALPHGGLLRFSAGAGDSDELIQFIEKLNIGRLVSKLKT